LKENKINDLIKKLDWDAPLEAQYEAIEKLSDLKELDIIIESSKKDYLKENCALILSNYSNEELLPYLSKLFEWLKDEDIPGFFIIHERIQGFPKQRIEDAYKKAIKLAKTSKNNRWLEILETLRFE